MYNFLEAIKNGEHLKELLNQGQTVQKALHVPPELMNTFYKIAFKLFEEERYKDAGNAFLFLACLDPHQYEYWLGLGMANQMCHEYEAAIDAYELAALNELESPVPYFYLAKCLFAIHDRESSVQALDLAIELADEYEEFEALKAQAIAAKELLLESE